MTATPRVRAWAVFRRLTASENLHQLGRPPEMHHSAFRIIPRHDPKRKIRPGMIVARGVLK